MPRLVKMTHPDIDGVCHVPEQTARVLERSGWRREAVEDVEPVPPGRSAPEERSLDDLTVDELRDLARVRDVEGRSSMSKDELVAALS